MKRGWLMAAGALSVHGAAAQAKAQPVAEGASSDEGSEIVVTAQRRSERLIDVPVSVTAIDAAQLQPGGITDIDTLTRAAPGVVINRQGAYLQPTIRGVGTNVTGASADPAVAIYVDGVYQPSGTGSIIDLPNVEQVEILRGPQGTLFGRNSTGGAILISTRNPSFTPSARASAAYGNMNEYSGSMYLNGGLSAKIAANLSAYYRHSDGWIDDLRTGEDRNRQYSLDVRGKILVQPTETLSLTFVADYNATQDPTGNAPIAFRGNTGARPLAGSGPIATRRGTLSADQKPSVLAKTTTLQLNGALDLDFATLSTITAYRRENGFIAGDLDASYVNVQNVEYFQRYRTFTQEAILTSPSGPAFTWVAGVYYFRQKAYVPLPGFLFPTPRPNYNSDIQSDALSGFADGTYDFGRLSIFGGLRYSTERKELNFAPGAAARTRIAAKRYSQLTPRAGARFEISDRSNVYASWNRGFKSGTYNSSSASPLAVRPESVDAYEIGFKTSTPTFSFATAAYYTSYEDIQVTAFDFSQGGVSRLFNAAKAEIYGLEADMTVRPTEGLTLRGAAAYTHARYTSFRGAPAFQPRPGGLTGNVPVAGGIDASGATMIRAPEFTLSGTVTYRVPAGDGYVEASLSPYYTSKVNYTFSERLQQPGYATFDGTISYAPDEHWRFSLYGRNLTDKVYASFMSETSIRDSIIYARPRTYGITAAYQF